MELYNYAFKCQIYDESTNGTKTVYHVIQTYTFVEAVKEIEDWYDNKLCGFTVDCLDALLVELTEESYKKLFE